MPSQEIEINTSYYYRLTNSFLGDGRSLDIYSDGNNAPFMGTTGNYSGQPWKLTPTGNGYYRLTNSFLGDGRSLDTYVIQKLLKFFRKSLKLSERCSDFVQGLTFLKRQG